MSHIVQIQTEVRDPVAIAAACRRLGLPTPIDGRHELFAGQTATGLGIQLRGWLYPAVFDTASGTMSADTYGGRWGEQQELDKFLQGYGVCKATAEAKRKGYAVAEQSLPDGSIKLTVNVGGW